LSFVRLVLQNKALPILITPLGDQLGTDLSSAIDCG